MVYQEAIKVFKEKLKEEYGEILVDIILYGSYARGDQDKDSDIDLLVLLREIKDFWEEVHRISEIESQIHELFDYKILLTAIPASISDFNNKKTPLFLNIKEEGISV